MIPREASHPRSEIIILSKFVLREKCTLIFVDRCLVPVRRFPSPSWSIHFAWTTRLETLWPRAIMRPRDYAKWTAQGGRNTTQIHMQLATPQSMTSLRLPSRYMIYLVGSRSDVIDCGVELHEGFWATRLPLATKAKMFVHPFWKMFTVGEWRPILVTQIMYDAVKRLRDSLASRHLSALSAIHVYSSNVMNWVEVRLLPSIPCLFSSNISLNSW